MNNEFSRQPRFLPDMPRGEVEVPNPPMINEKPDISWFGLLLPPAVMLVITILIAMTSQSMFMLISIATTIMTLIASLTGATTQIRKYKRKKKEREEKYLQFIADTRSELTLAREQQVKAMNEMNPEPAECVQRIMRTDNKLWEKTPSYNDFLSLRIGVGSAPLELKIKYTKQAIVLETDPLLMEPQKLALEFEKIPQVPITIDLMASDICGIAGEAVKTSELIRLMLLQIVTHHGYDDVRVILLASEAGLERWSWLKYLPHIWDDGFHVRFLLCGKAMAHQMLSELYSAIKEREMKSVGGSALPHYLFIVEDVSLLENEQISKYLYNGSAKLGVSTLFIAPNPAYLPMNCKTVINLQGKSGEMADRISGEKIAFTPDQADLKDLDQAARMLAPLRIRNASVNFALPASITLMDMLHAETAADVDLLFNWVKNKTFMGMSVPIGVRAGGESLHLDMHETGYGPHGLVAGTTGSGKSELLQSIIISQAIHYHPHDIVFVLIDYKGGGMADVFKGMPHLVGTITNLDGNQTTRALLSIKSELMSRQRIFSEYGVNSIDKYQKLFYSKNGNQSMPAIPHLIMIADEFAELKQDQPDFMKELVSTARVGRSLGVHLILATQKPAGVVDDQIWSNSKFKICLKVQDEADSRDVIKRPDAAMIKEPGRAYIQVGNDEIFELFQSAYSGADYDPNGQLKKNENKVKRLFKVSLNGRSEQIYPLEEEKIARNELPSQLHAMVEHITRTAAQFGIEPIKGPWLPPLPNIVFFDKLIRNGYSKGAWAKQEKLLRVPIGFMDDPRGQRQEPLEMDFAAEGNLFVYGTPGTGKTIFLKTLCMSMALLYSPEDVHIYIMDFGGNTLKPFERLPHVGGIMTLEQEDKIDQFMLFLFRIMEERKEEFEKSGSEGFNDYRKSGKGMAAIVVVIDNYFALSETYEAIDEQMVLLAREGFKYGIYIVATATNASLVRYKFSVNFKMAISFQMTEKSEYDGIVGRTEGLEPAKAAGRGLVRGKPPLEFQTSLPEYEGQSTEQLLEMFGGLEVIQATPIPVMPAHLDMREINRETERLAIGLGNNDLQPVFVDLHATPVLMIAGEAMSGKSTLLVSWIKLLSEKQKGLEVYALDSSGMGIYELMNQPYTTDLSSVEDMNDFTDSVKEKLNERRSQLLACRMSGGDSAAIMKEWHQIVFVIDRFSELTNNDMYSLHELLERIIKQERGMKVAVIAADNTSDLASNWDTLGKAIREEQTGILLGRIKEQNLYSVSFPFGKQEKNTEQGDGYFIIKNKFTGLRCASL
ncbi:S-DNA-T family DNA segregation ATPase FtsK/SpoIIIE [Paenibacillus castaneae]|uniref:type VII secretion protein EssC n=1 Tax=Paenibacillus castaneae TaxID=474957 RepID=UPI000C9D2133|nr:type VII secretion protein EssC [Paenibacillus castaneae]NIK77497.1 S-DNA-T family DNA segregation ATPase FtsK/SpoIIIE [Paenibacillus castaneae]